MDRISLRIAGRVQGVGFRWFVLKEARRLGLAGHVRNLPDGCVEVMAEGPGPALAQLEAQCRRGPQGARVLQVERGPDPSAEPFDSAFEIR